MLGGSLHAFFFTKKHYMPFQVKKEFIKSRFVGWLGKKQIDKAFAEFTKKDIEAFIKNHSSKDVRKFLIEVQQDETTEKTNKEPKSSKTE